MPRGRDRGNRLCVTKRMPIELVGSPAHLPRAPKGRVAVLDVAFADGARFEEATEPFIAGLGNRLALWCDHHEHLIGWARYRDDPRFLLVSNREAHACPELITPEVASRAGRIDAMVIHGDLDGMLTAVKLLLGGKPPYPDADEDARAVDSPGRGHALSPRARRLARAVDEAVATFPTAARRDFMIAIIWALAEGTEPSALAVQIDEAAALAEAAHEEAVRLAQEHAREELPGVLVMRLPGRRKGRQRKAILRWAEELAPAGVVVETEPNHTWVTAATFDPRVDLSSIDLLQGGRSDYRYAEPKGSVDLILRAVARAVDERG